MKTLGLIGGTTWHSTVDYYRLINQGVQERLGGHSSAAMVMVSVDFAPVQDLQDKGDWSALGRLMVRAAKTLEGAGAEAIVICANTMHQLAPDIAAACRLPIIHIADAAAAAVKGRGLTAVGLLGTRFTMEMDFYRARLEKEHGLKVLVPDAPERAVVHDVIYDELGRGLVREESRRAYVKIIDGLAGRGAQGVILGCTEIPLLIKEKDSPVPVFDTTALHAAAAVDFALGG
ncbi:MAG TPA: aspartate/glutamate racemase family protein [Candidatus Aminicenantes bacterium]|nr:aspartate/glutamate racemase family protein [Candidatus Aminicenantes bacterium]HRY65155.1 aspartate/glutamate racemase family protein [Candidatus Aminicenantes bacterium]HRZ72377.1 aspartate/glutamate racemase family protein [Candidatus Aminicenantes bacterium]